MPTKTEIDELIDNCTMVWMSQNGINGCRFTSKKEGYTDKSIFFPAAGNWYNTILRDVGVTGLYWSSSLNTKDPRYAYDMFFYSADVFYNGHDLRLFGQPIRPVYDERIHPESVSLNKTSLTLTVGISEQLTTTILPETATDKTVSWSSSDESIATVSSTGLVTGVAAGSAIITVTTTDGGKIASCSVVVKEIVIPVTGVTLDKDTAEVFEGETLTLTAIVSPENATNKMVVWSSSDESVATVEDGVVTAISCGDVTIRVVEQLSGLSSSCLVRVKKGIDIHCFAYKFTSYNLKYYYYHYINWEDIPNTNPLYRETPIAMKQSNGHLYYLYRDSYLKDDARILLPEGFTASCIDVDDDDVYVGGSYQSRPTVLRNGSIWKEWSLEYDATSGGVSSIDYSNGHIYAAGTFAVTERNSSMPVEWYDDTCTIIEDTRESAYKREDVVMAIMLYKGKRLLSWYESHGGINQYTHFVVDNNDIIIPNGSGGAFLAVDDNNIYLLGHVIEKYNGISFSVPTLWVYDGETLDLKYSVKVRNIYDGNTSTTTTTVNSMMVLNGIVYISGNTIIQSKSYGLFWEVSGNKIIGCNGVGDKSAAYVYAVDNRR